jgi:hypothetical protein
MDTVIHWINERVDANTVVGGHELRDYPALGHADLVNRGRHRLLAGGRHDAFLAVPVIEVTR